LSLLRRVRAESDESVRSIMWFAAPPRREGVSVKSITLDRRGGSGAGGSEPKAKFCFFFSRMATLRLCELKNIFWVVENRKCFLYLQIT
jgi:hypothetical protein